MVEIYESADTLRDQQPDLTQEGGSHTQTYLPAVQRSRNPFRAAAVSLGLLGLLLVTGIIVLSIYWRSCSEGWTKFGCSCYYKSTEKKTWANSRVKCQEEGADLVVINSKEEQEFVIKLNKNEDSWIGLCTVQKEKWKWKWVDGSLLTLSNWAAGEPQKYHYENYASCCNYRGQWTQGCYYNLTQERNQLQTEVNQMKRKIADIYARPDFTKKVRYNRGDQEERGEREERMVEIYESADTLRDQQPDLTQEGGSHTQTYLPAVQRSRNPFRAAAVSLGLLGLLLVTGIIVLSIYYISVIVEREKLVLQRDQLNISHNNLLTSYHNLIQEKNQLKTSYHDLTQERNQLLTSYHNLIQEKNQSLTEVNQLIGKIAGKSCSEGWEKFGCSCYYKSTEKKTWANSRWDCHSKGSDLVVINSREEQEFVSKLNQDGASWIGLHYTARRMWEWVDGSLLTSTYWAVRLPQSPSYKPYVLCCNHQGQWTQMWNDFKFWICEK
ncbi:uncharacterized protein LOC139919268 [Centroberyx gerrardi]